jgi:hypothetical protein
VLDLHPDIELAHERQHLIQQRQGLAIGEPDPAHLRRREERDGAEPGHIRVVVHDDRAVPRRVDVELDAVGVEHDRAAKRGPRVLVLVSRGAPMGYDGWPWHRLKGTSA